jgi:hypothetical protein
MARPAPQARAASTPIKRRVVAMTRIGIIVVERYCRLVPAAVARQLDGCSILEVLAWR